MSPGTYLENELPWSPRVRDALQGLNPGDRNSENAQYLGDLLRAFLTPLGWDADERELKQALKAGREVHLTLRFAAAELYVLPWELLTLGSSRRHLGAVRGVHLRYEAPRDEEPSDTPPVPRGEGGRLLFAWSAPTRPVPIEAHLGAIQQACRVSSYPFDAREDVLGNVSVAGLERALKESRKPVEILHVLCHGGPRGSVYGLLWSPADPSADPELIDAASLRELLAPYAGSLRLVVLCACTSGDAGALVSHLGGLAQGLHAIGIRAVIASRLPLSVEGSNVLAKTLYEHLLVRHASLQQALAASREALKPLTRTMDWATLQLYAHPDEPLHQFPFVFRPYQGLLSFGEEHRAFFFGRATQKREWLGRLKEAERGARPRLQVLAGPSGSGKSSLAKAGILPELAAEGWEILSKRAVDAGLLGEVQRLRRERPGSGRLLLVDQLEEIFTRPVEEREPLARALWELSKADEVRTVVLLTLRLDALERCAELRLDEAGTLLSAIVLDRRHHAFLPPLQAEQYREVITGPARWTGLTFQPGLVEQLVREAGQEPGALPLLEHALDLLWEQREGNTITQAAYDALGGLTGALTHSVDALYEGLSPAEQRQMRRLLVELVDFRDSLALATRRRESLARSRPAAPSAREIFDAVVERLVSHRLLVRGEEPGSEGAGGWIEVAHEAFIRRWERLGQWLREDAERVLALRTVRGWAQEWAKHRGDSDGGAGYLPAGSRLAYLRELRERYAEELEGPAEKAFVEAAEAADRQRDQRFLESVRIANRLLADIRGLADVPGMDLRRKSLLEQVERMLDNLIQSAGTRPVALRARAVACNERGEVALELDEWEEAQRLYETAMGIARELHRQAPSEILAREDLAVSHDKLGALAERRGNLEEASEHYEAALRITEQLAEEQPGDVQLRIELACALQRSGGRMLAASRNPDVARGRLEKAFALLQQLVDAGASHPELRPALASCLATLGDFEATHGSAAAAERRFLAALDILVGPWDPQPASPQARRQVADLYTKLGWLALGRRDAPEALQRHLNALGLLEALAQQNPRNTQLQSELAISLRSVGEVKAVEGDLDKAQGYLSEARERLEDLVSRAPADPELRLALLLTVLELGRVAKALGDRPALDRDVASAAALLADIERAAVWQDLVSSLREKLKTLQEP